MSRSTYAVSGMVCGHCAGFVAEEIERVAGVTAVAVDVENGIVTVTSDRDLDVADVRAAVEEAGYELVQLITGVADRLAGAEQPEVP